MSGKRLNKVAKEYNVSIATIVDFLGTKGVKLDSNPNTKVEQEMLVILDGEFADDKTAKQASENVAISREKRESISLKDVKKEKPADENEEEEELPKPKKARAVKKEEEEPVAEVKPVEPVSDKPKVAVVGKIDLDALNQKTRPDKKKKLRR
jgi:translation initiation factor IF-2